METNWCNRNTQTAAVALKEWSMLSTSSCGSVLGVIGPTLEDPQQTDAESQTLSQRESLRVLTLMSHDGNTGNS